MNTASIKLQIRKMIDEQDDKSVLEAIYILLQKTSLNPQLKLKLTNRALKAEKDIAENRVFSKKEMIERTNRIVK